MCKFYNLLKGNGLERKNAVEYLKILIYRTISQKKGAFFDGGLSFEYYMLSRLILTMIIKNVPDVCNITRDAMCFGYTTIS